MKHNFRLVLVSNRGPYRLGQSPRGLRRERTVGGLVTSLLPMMEQNGGAWVAWGDPPGRYPIPPNKTRFELNYIGLTEEQVQNYYVGFSNNALWPMCHGFLGQAHYD